MATIERVRNLEDPRLLPFRNQKDQWLRARHRAGSSGSGGSGTGLDPGVPGDLFMAEGLALLERLLGSPHAVRSVLVSEHRLDAAGPVLERVPSGSDVFAAPRDVVAEIVGFDLHRGVLACGRRVETHTAEDLIERAGLLVVLEGLSNHDNVGSIFRSVDALAPRGEGFEPRAGVLLTPGCCDPLYRKALRVSMGAALRVPFAEIGDWPDRLGSIAAAGCRPVVLTPGEDAADLAGLLAQSGVPGGGERFALLLGAEGPGLSGRALAACDRVGGVRGRIGIEPGVDSLNVGVAAGIALHRLRSRA